MFKYRLISFPILMGIAFAVVFWQPYGSWIFAAVAVPLIMAAALECCNMAESAKLHVNAYAAAAITVLAMVKYGLTVPELATFRDRLPGAGTLAVILLLWLLLQLLFAKQREKSVQSLFATPGTVALALLPALPLVMVFYEYGPLYFISLALCTKAADTGGYIFGMLSGKLMKNGNHKIVPSISPKKSWEGTVGAALFSIGTAFLLNRFDCLTLDLNCWQLVVFGFLAFLGSFAGDLTESCLKRAAGIKDSGSWIPGMGGIMDVLDSFLYNAPLFYLALKSGVLVCQ